MVQLETSPAAIKLLSVLVKPVNACALVIHPFQGTDLIPTVSSGHWQSWG